MRICTIIAKNYVAQARVLADSFRERHPEGRCAVLVIDDPTGYLDPSEEPFELITPDRIGLPEFEQMASSYDVLELSTAVKPWLIRHLLETHDEATVTYLDPDIWITDDLEEIGTLAERHGLVLTPHTTGPIPRDGKRPADADILAAGTYNLGFISLARGAVTDGVLDWWSERLLEGCLNDPARGYFVDQRWIDLLPGMVPDVHVLRDPGYNVAYWNLPNRRLQRENGHYLVDERPLRFFHFSGFNPLQPGELSKHQDRIQMGHEPVLSQLCADYAGAVLARGYEQAIDWPYDWNYLPDRTRVDRYMRALFREGLAAGRLAEPIFTEAGADALLAYGREPTDRPGGSRGVNRYLRAVYDERPDLQRAFPRLGGEDGPRLCEWAHTSRHEIGIPAALLPSRPSRRTAAGGNGAGQAAASAGPAAAKPGRRPPRAAGAPEAASPTWGVNVAGYLTAELGVGEAARQMIAALDAESVPVAPLGVQVTSSRMNHAFERLGATTGPFAVNLICVNADMLPQFAQRVGPQFFANRHSAGLWFWEVDTFPPRWQSSFEHLDEVWACSEHVAQAIEAVSPLPVWRARLPVTPAAPALAPRSALGLPEGFCFLFVFDHNSILERKNPVGLIESFRRAFPDGSEASLVIKSINGERHPAGARRLQAAAKGHDSIHLIDRYVSAAEKSAMIASCDAYVSLHRSEGFGLTLAEAMYFGRPTIATGFSGNLDFMTPANSYLVDHEMARIGEGAEPYPADASWAEPDLDHAAELMRRVFENREEAVRRGRTAAASIRESHSPQAAGRRLSEHLESVREARFAGNQGVEATPRSAAAPAAIPDQRTRALVSRRDLAHAPGTSRLRGIARKGLFRLLRPFTTQQREINRGLLEAIGDLRRQLTDLGGQLDSEQAGLLAGLRRRDHDHRSLSEAVHEIGGRLAALGDQLRHLSDLEAAASEASAAQGKALEANARQIDAVRTAHEKLTADVRGTLEAHRERIESVRQGQAELAERLAGQDASRALEALSERIESVRRGQAELAQRLAAQAASLEAPLRLVTEARAIPFMAGHPLELFEHERLGTVTGFQGPAASGAARGYRGFEDVFRGSEELIRDRQRGYLPLVEDRSPVLDAGCGRGEFLDLLAEAGIEAIGVDSDAEMVEHCRRKGHAQVHEADVNSFLGEVGDGELGALFSAQLVEHLPSEQLQRLLELSLRCLRPGGLFIAETVNPHSPQALKTFWVDPTHQHPLFPEVMLVLCQLAGFEQGFVFYPNGSGDPEADRNETGEYAVVATVPGAIGS